MLNFHIMYHWNVGSERSKTLSQKEMVYISKNPNKLGDFITVLSLF